MLMSWSRRLRVVSGALSLSLFLAPFGATAVASPLAPIEQKVLDELAVKNEATYWIVLRQRADLSAAPSIKDWNQRGQYVYDQLTQTADRSQRALRAELTNRGLAYQPFWIVNAIRVTSDHAMMLAFASRAEVSQILAPKVYRNEEPTRNPMPEDTESIGWNINSTNAPFVWSTFNVRGEGVIVANIDSGVQYNHPALVAQYRGNLGGGVFDHNYNWFDPAHICGNPSLVPCDNNDHGTHTMGTMVGDDGASHQIGVAPHAKWMTAKGCENTSCTDNSLLASGQWMLAPTNLAGNTPRADLRPNVINNSWGNDNANDLFYQSIVGSWIASGIFPAFSAGNDGPSCGSGGSPGSYEQTFSAGAYDINNHIASFSGRGPSPVSRFAKPNIAAPGVNVVSSVPTNGYAGFDGTSMASPHVAGTVALMISAAPTLLGNITQLKTLLSQTAIDVSDLSCGGTAGYNNVWGEGRLNAFEAVNQSPRVMLGTLAGTVTNVVTFAPIVNAQVTMTGPANYQAFTNLSGDYTAVVQAGNYQVTASASGYSPSSAVATVVENTTTTRNFALTPLVQLGVSGIVRDSEGQSVEGATVTLAGFPPVHTDPIGFYNFSPVPPNIYDVRAGLGGCNNGVTQTVVVQEGPVVLDFVLPVLGDPQAPPCRLLVPPFFGGVRVP